MGLAFKKQREAIGRVFQQCPACESPYLEYEFVVEKSPVCGCQDCGLVFLNPQPGGRANDQPSGSVGPAGATEVYEKSAIDRVDQLIEYSGIRSGVLLLIGGDSHLTKAAINRHFEVVSLDPLQFESTSAEDLRILADVCILFCALEKMRDPLGSLKAIRAMLKPSGSLMVIAPTTDSRTAKRSKASWREFRKANLFYFSVDTLQNLLLRAGFGDPFITPDRGLVSLTRFLVRPKVPASKPLLSVIVPVYNEASTFVELIEELLAKRIEGIDIEIIIIESNSNDGSRELVMRYENQPSIRVILEDKPMGKGHAVRTGLKAASGEIVLFQDADLEYDINDYDALIAPLLHFRANFVLGSRHSSGRNSWKIRQYSDSRGLAAFFNVGHVLFLALFNAFYSQRLSDPFTMFKVFRRECLYGLQFETNRFDFDYEIVIKLLRKGYRPIEIPVNYKSRSIGEGKKVTLFRDPLTWIRAMLKFRKSPLYGQDRPSR